MLGLVLGGCSFLRTQQPPQTVKIGESGSGTRTETFVTAMPAGTPAVPGHGKEVGMAYGAVSGQEPVQANGVATAHYLEDGTSVIGIQANIKAAEDGFYYEAWARKSEASGHISLGHLTNPYNDVRHSVRFEGAENLSDYSEIVISLQSASAPAERGPTVATAKLKRASR
jgi:hypothetical protein